MSGLKSRREGGVSVCRGWGACTSQQGGLAGRDGPCRGRGLSQTSWCVRSGLLQSSEGSRGLAFTYMVVVGLSRTRKPYAFYTLILAFIFELRQDPSHQPQPYLLKLHPCIGAYTNYFRFNLRRLIFGFGTTSSERRLVPLPCKGIKPVIYYTSIRQREHTHCCQLNLRSLSLRR